MFSHLKRTCLAAAVACTAPQAHAATSGPFPSSFERALFCAVAVPIVSKTIGKSWSAKELGSRFRHAVDTVMAEGHKRGLSDVAITQALDREADRQNAAVVSRQQVKIAGLYKYCD